MVHEFFMPIRKIPTTTHQEKKVAVQNGKPVFYEPEDLKKARELLTNHLSGYIPDKPFDGPLQCRVKWLFHSDKHKDGEWRKTKPDSHNLNKLLFDVMTDLGFWVDDALVVSEHIQKFWVRESPSGIYIRIEELK